MGKIPRFLAILLKLLVGGDLFAKFAPKMPCPVLI